MNLHTEKPACYLTTDPLPRAPGFKDDGRWCYTTQKEIDELTPGCQGCTRRKAT